MEAMGQLNALVLELAGAAGWMGSAGCCPQERLFYSFLFSFSFNLKNSFHHSLKINQNKESCSRRDPCPALCTCGRFHLQKNQCRFLSKSNNPFRYPPPVPSVRRGKENLKYKSKSKRRGGSSNDQINMVFINTPLSSCSRK